MENMKHTRGPWQIIETRRDRPGKLDRIIIGHGEYATAFVPVYGESSIENARLIAAAPCLLEAANALLRKLEDHPAFGCYDGFGKRDQANLRDFYNQPEIKALVRAIAKAEGEK